MGAIAKFVTLIGVLSVGSYMIYETIGRLETARSTAGQESAGPDQSSPAPTFAATKGAPETLLDNAPQWDALTADASTTVSDNVEPAVGRLEPEPDVNFATADETPGLDFRAPIDHSEPENLPPRMPDDAAGEIRLVSGEEFFEDDSPRKPTGDPFPELPNTAPPSATATADPFALDHAQTSNAPSPTPKSPASPEFFGDDDVPAKPAAPATAKPAAAEFFADEDDPFAADPPKKPVTESKLPALVDDFPVLEAPAKPASTKSSDDPFALDPPAEKTPAKLPTPADDFPAFDKSAPSPTKPEPDPFTVDVPHRPEAGKSPAPTDNFPALDAPSAKATAPATNKSPATADPFATDFPALEEQPKTTSEPAKLTPPAEADPFATDFPALDKPAAPKAENKTSLPATLDKFPPLETPAAKTPADDSFPALDNPPGAKTPSDFPADLFEPVETPKVETPEPKTPLTLDELMPLEEKPEFPGFEAKPKPLDEEKPTENSDPFPSLEVPSEPITETKPALDPPKESAPAAAPPKEINVVDDPTMPSLDDLKGDGTLTAETPRGKLLPQLEIQKQAPKSALLNKPFVYTIVVKNVGQSAAEDVTVQDQIPRGTTLTGTIPQAEMIGERQKRLVWKLGRIEPGDEEKIAVRVVPVEAGTIGSVATVNFVAEVGAETLISDTAVSMKIEAPSEAKVGEVVSFQFKIRNDSRQTLTGVVLRDLIPEGLHHPAGTDLENPLGELPPGQELVETLEMKVLQPGTLVNRAILTANGGLEIQAEATLNAGGNNLTILRSGPKQRFVGRAAIYQNTVTNTSPETITDALVVEQIPEGMEFVSADTGGQYYAGTRSIYWKVDALEPGQSLKLQAKLSPQQEGELRSVVKVIEQNKNEIQTVSHTTVQTYEALGVELTEFNRTFGVGEKVILRIEAINRGNESAENVSLRAKIPPSMQLMAVRGQVRYRIEGREVVFEPLRALDPGGNELIELELQAAQPSNAQVAVNIQSGRMERPMSRETAVQIVGAARR